jgi:hypothetical protein
MEQHGETSEIKQLKLYKANKVTYGLEMWTPWENKKKLFKALGFLFYKLKLGMSLTEDNRGEPCYAKHAKWNINDKILDYG